MLRKKFLFLFLFLALIMVTAGIWTGTAQADPPESECTMGAVQSALQATPIGAWNVGESRGGLGAGVSNCRVPLFADGETFTFNSSDYLVLGFTNFIPYEYLGLTRQEGKALLLSAEETFYFGEAGSTLGEQEIVRTAVKTAHHPDLGPVVYQEIGFIVQLEAGDYETHMVEEWIYGHYEATTYLTIED